MAEDDFEKLLYETKRKNDESMARIAASSRLINKKIREILDHI